MTKNRTRTLVYLDPGMHPGLEVKGLNTLMRHSCAEGTEIPSYVNCTPTWVRVDMGTS